MKASEFCFWLQGYFELSESEELTTKQVECVKKHLHLAFVHDIDHTHGSAEEQAALNEIHSGTVTNAKMAPYAPPVTDGLNSAIPHRPFPDEPVIRC